MLSPDACRRTACRPASRADQAAIAVRPRSRQRHAAEQDLAPSRTMQAQQQLHQRGLATARGAGDGHALAGWYRAGSAPPAPAVRHRRSGTRHCAVRCRRHSARRHRSAGRPSSSGSGSTMSATRSRMQAHHPQFAAACRSAPPCAARTGPCSSMKANSMPTEKRWSRTASAASQMTATRSRPNSVLPMSGRKATSGPCAVRR